MEFPWFGITQLLRCKKGSAVSKLMGRKIDMNTEMIIQNAEKPTTKIFITLDMYSVAQLIRTPFVVKIESIKNEKRKHIEVRGMTKKVASTTRLIFPCSAVGLSKSEMSGAPRQPTPACDYSRTDYDECAHGWLDGLNRLFMEAKLVATRTQRPWSLPSAQQGQFVSRV